MNKYQTNISINGQNGIKHLLADWAKNYIFSVQELSIFWLLFLMPLITWHSCPHPPCRRRTSAASTAYEREERGGGGSSRRDGGEESARSRREAGGGGAAAGRDRPVREAWPEHREPANRYLRYFDTRKLTVEPRYYLMLGGGTLGAHRVTRLICWIDRFIFMTRIITMHFCPRHETSIHC